MGGLPEPRHLRPGLRLPAIVDRRQVFGQRPVLRAVEIEVVGKHQPRAMRLAGGEEVRHGQWPALLPEVGEVGQTKGADDRVGAGGRRADRGGVHDIGGNEIRGGRQVLRPGALDDADRPAGRQQLGGDFAAEGTVTDDGDGDAGGGGMSGGRSCWSPLGFKGDVGREFQTRRGNRRETPGTKPPVGRCVGERPGQAACAAISGALASPRSTTMPIASVHTAQSV